jgi:hypothetical protein
MQEYVRKLERHGCLVCGRVHSVLVVYRLDGDLVDSKVTSYGGHALEDEQHVLVVCDIHTAEAVEQAHQNWQTRRNAVAEMLEGE